MHGSFVSKRNLVLLLVLINLVFVSVLFFRNSKLDFSKALRVQPTDYPEIKDLSEKKYDFKQLSNYFTALAEKKGAAYAYKVLEAAPIPPGIDMHLLGHVVGDILYKQQGAKGIQICTQDFRNACSHSIVVGLLLEKGNGVMPEIAEICRKAPGGSGAYTMCFHGLGHGVLAYTEYDLEKAIEICETTGTDAYGKREYIECVGGTIMEIIGGGFHNPDLWKVQSKKYLKNDNPTYPCSADFMPEIARPQCYTYLTPHLFVAAGANLANPGQIHFEKAFLFCNDIPKQDGASRNACFSGFGKEFVVLAKNRDIRNISQLTETELKKVHDWCMLGKTGNAIAPCLSSAAASMYWGGENDRGVVIRFCKIIQDKNFQSSCFTGIIDSVGYYIKDRTYKEEFCGELPETYQKECQGRLLK